MTQRRDTRTRILDVAEELFGEHGVDGVSIRDITRKARVNLAAIHYHFGRKDALVAAVFERRIVPVNQARMAAMDALRRGPGKKPSLEGILEAFIRPTVECSFGTPRGGKAFSKMFGRCLSEPSPEIEVLLRRQFDPLVDRLHAELTRALPGISRSEIHWCLKFTFGALHHWLLTKDAFLPSWMERVDVEQQIRKLVSFAAGGFRAA
jgi:AcrR family transcriptional regulator